MKKRIFALLATLTFALAASVYADKGAPVFKKGDKVYVCDCGDGCDCLTVSRNKGKCGCNKPMAKTVIDKVDADKIYTKVKGKELTFPVKANYICGCGEACKCGTVSQKPGKCSCGSDMKKVE